MASPSAGTRRQSNAQSEFVSKGAWKILTAGAKSARKPALAAVAYFGKGASKLLPLPPGSHLVVDASEHAVKKGQTHPNDLKHLQRGGVVIFSSPSLHAKVFIFENVAFIGSTNVSKRSSKILTEAVVKTSDRAVVRSAKTFVKRLCLDEVGPDRLDKLQKLYRPPQLPSGGASQQERSRLPSLRLAQLRLIDAPEGSEATEEKGLKIARSRRKKKRGYIVDNFWWPGKCPYYEDDKVIQVTEYANGQRLIDAPADVIHTRPWRGRDGREVTFVYLELPDVRRVSLNTLAKRLGRGAKKNLYKNGIVRDEDFAEKLLANWNQL
ncbi:phospholipase D family protein [Bradyrhizobium diazoefficiens]